MSENNNEELQPEIAEEINTETKEEETSAEVLTEETTESEEKEEDPEENEPEENEPEENKTEETTEPEENETEENPAEDNGSDAEEEKIKKKIPWKKIIIAAACVVGVIGILYAGGIGYYSKHFFMGTDIGNFDCSNMTPAKAKESIAGEIEDYTFVIHEKNGEREVITAEEIELNHSVLEDFDHLLKEQRPYMWIFNWKKKHLPLNMDVTLNEDKLYSRISELDVSKASKQAMDGSVACIYYENGSYHVKDDGSKDIVSVNKIFNLAKNKIIDLYSGMVLEDEGCYVGMEGEDSMAGVLNAINKFVSTKITYKKGEGTVELNGDTIRDWVIIKDNYSIDVDKSKVRAYVDNLAKDINTVGKARQFKTSGGTEITVSGGDYGWAIDNNKETEALNSLIWNGAVEEREPIYKKKAATHANNDISNTYVEVSIAAQHAWYYKNGALQLSTDVVTGNPIRGNGTHTGVFSIKYKQKDATLKGEDYTTPVNFWMPFNGGEGLHDATWRGAFGGSIYRGGGSHGCVNMPYSAAAQLFGTLDVGTPVVVY